MYVVYDYETFGGLNLQEFLQTKVLVCKKTITYNMHDIMYHKLDVE